MERPIGGRQEQEEVALMRRIIMLVVVALVMSAMMVAMAMPVFASHGGVGPTHRPCLMKLSEKPRTRLRRSPADRQRIHARSVARTPFRTVSMRSSLLCILGSTMARWGNGPLLQSHEEPLHGKMRPTAP